MVSVAEARALYRTFLRESTKFPNYNIREYIRRRAKEAFSSAPAPGASQEEMWKLVKQEMDVVKRQAVVFNLYSRKHVKNVMELRPIPN